MKLYGAFSIAFIVFFLASKVEAAKSCAAASSLAFFDKYEQADAIFFGEAQSIEKLEPHQGELDRVAIVKVKKVWKGPKLGRANILYKDRGKGCAREGYVDSPKSGMKVYFVKKNGKDYSTSFEMGTLRERSIINMGEMAGLDFMSKKHVSREEYEAFKEKNRKEFKLFR